MGRLRVAANVEEPRRSSMVKNGELRGLSLGTAMTLDGDGNVAYRGQDELSICEEGKRPGTWIDTMDGVPCRAVECFSKSKAGAQMCRPSAKMIWPHCDPSSKPGTCLRLPPHPRMSEAEIASTMPPQMQNRDDLVERLKRELAEKTEGEARANARA